jgi:Zn-dependent M16 (insulinase) family peptidase
LEKLQAFRQNVLNVRIDDLKRVTQTYLHPDKASTAVITNAATLEQKGNLGLEVINL